MNSVAIQGSSPFKSESRIFPINGFDNLDVASLLISEPPGSILSFAVTSPGAISRATVAAMWSED